MNAKEIIQRAIDEKSAEFRAAMIAQAEIHDDAADLASHSLVKRSAENQRRACLNIYDAIAGGIDRIPGGDIDAIVNVISHCVIALNAACKLLDIGPALRTSAIVDWQEIQRASGIWPSD